MDEVGEEDLQGYPIDCSNFAHRNFGNRGVVVGTGVVASAGTGGEAVLGILEDYLQQCEQVILRLRYLPVLSCLSVTFYPLSSMCLSLPLSLSQRMAYSMRAWVAEVASYYQEKDWDVDLVDRLNTVMHMQHRVSHHTVRAQAVVHANGNGG